jgi:DnaJ-class molecular chaperone
MDKITCKECKGVGYIDVLISAHGNEKETILCPNCKGKGIINMMSDEEEDDYHADYW